MARANRRGKKRKALRYLILAALTLVVAGFIARHEIPILISESHPPARQHTNVQTSGAATRTALNRQTRTNQDSPNESLSGADRRRLDDVIRERAR